MDFRMVSLPPFQAASSGLVKDFDFSPAGALGAYASEVLELDIRLGHYALGHIITPPEIIAAQGWAQMETFIPIKLKREQK